MIDINKQLDYWKNGADNDLETAELLISSRKYIEGLFFCHLTIEKIFKALVVKKTKQLAPKTHILNYLHELTNVELSDQNTVFLSILMKYQLEGRYPDFNPKVPPFETVNDYLCKTKALFECLRQML
jgi:HEPN domain-containing protein